MTQNIELAINIETIYGELDICEKIHKVSAAGFHAVEFWGWDGRDIEKVQKTCKECGVKVRAFSGTKEWSLCDRANREHYIDWVRQSIDTAKKLACDTLILFPNHFTPTGCSDFRDIYSREAMIANITGTLTRLVPMLEEQNITVLLEPLCNTGSDAGMSVTDTSVGADIIRAVGSEKVKLLCDVYHMQMMHGNLLNNLLDNLDIVPYIHIADAPARHEPGTGEINFKFLARKLLESDFCGTVCMEYFPEGDTEEGFTAVRQFLNQLQR